jgi:hypothetical protein
MATRPGTCRGRFNGHSIGFRGRLFGARHRLYRPRNVRAHRVYGLSPVHQGLMIVNIAPRRQLWQLDYFTEGSILDALIGVPQGWLGN